MALCALSGRGEERVKRSSFGSLGRRGLRSRLNSVGDVCVKAVDGMSGVRDGKTMANTEGAVVAMANGFVTQWVWALFLCSNGIPVFALLLSSLLFSTRIGSVWWCRHALVGLFTGVVWWRQGGCLCYSSVWQSSAAHPRPTSHDTPTSKSTSTPVLVLVLVLVLSRHRPVWFARHPRRPNNNSNPRTSKRSPTPSSFSSRSGRSSRPRQPTSTRLTSAG